jgi:hypothetical protein
MSISSTGLSDWELGPLVVSPKIAGHMLSCGLTKIYELIGSRAGVVLGWALAPDHDQINQGTHRTTARNSRELATRAQGLFGIPSQCGEEAT